MTQQTFVYKKAGDLEIKAEVFFDADSPAPRPVVVSIHGGALMGGARAESLGHLGKRLVAAGYAVVEIDYRLAPETKLPAIIEDLRDAHDWVRREGPALFGADPERLATTGGSAGGYLTLMAGIVVTPPPRALVSFYGYGDLVGDWYSKPDEFYLTHADIITEEDARSVICPAPITTPPPELAMPRLKLYHWSRQQGRWPQEVSGGHDPIVEADWFAPYCPIQNVTKRYPPTLLLHGEKDTDVPCQQSVDMAVELARVGVEHELATYPQGFHGFDFFVGAEPYHADAEDAVSRAFRFIERHTR